MRVAKGRGKEFEDVIDTPTTPEPRPDLIVAG
jgi:hypothetical protein